MKTRKSIFQRIGVIVISLPAVFSVATCAKNPVSGKRDFVLMSEDQEIKIGARAKPYRIRAITCGILASKEIERIGG